MSTGALRTSLICGMLFLIGFVSWAAGDEVVWQCDFEADDAPQSCGFQANDHVQRVSDDPAQGRWCLRHPAVAGSAWNMVQMASEDQSPYRPLTSITVKPGMLYRLGVQSRNTLTESPAIGFRILKGDKTTGYAWQTIPAGQGTWQYAQLLLEPDAGTTELQVYLRSTGESGDGCVWWDQVTVQAVEADAWGAPQAAALTMVPLDSLVIDTHDRTDAAAVMRLKFMASSAAIGTDLNIALTPRYRHSPAVWSYRQSLTSAGRIEVSMPVSQFPVGHYSLSVTAGGVTGQFMRIDKPLVVVDSLPFPVTKPAAVKTSVVGDDGLWRINGRPCLLIHYSHLGGTVAELAALRKAYGLTTKIAWTPTGTDRLYADVDTAWQAGLYSLVALFHPVMYDADKKSWRMDVLSEIVEKLKDHPGVIGWNLIDEPDGGSVPPENVKAAYDLIRSLDPDHIIWVNLCLPDKFGDYIHCSDLASYDHYPLPEGLAPITTYNDKMKAVMPHPMPLVSYLQTYAPGHSRLPTPRELRAELYQVIAEGGRQMFPYYSWWDPMPSWSLARDGELKSYTRLLNSELYALKPFLVSTETLGDPITALDAMEGRPLRYLARVADGRVTLVVVNTSSDDHGKVTFTLPWQRTTGQVTTLFEDGRKPMVNQRDITDAFGPYAVHVYQIN